MTKENLEVRIHHIMSLIGGFLGAYAILARTNIFGSAETTNMIAIVVGVLDNNLEAYLFRILALILFTSAIIFTVTLPKVCKFNIQYMSLVIDAIGMVILAFIAPDVNPIIALFPIFFMSAFQWNSFAKAKEYNCSTIFSTNNLRQAIIGFVEYVANKDPKQLDRGKFFGATLVYYHVGVVYAYVAVKLWGLQGSLAGIVPVAVAMIMFVMYREKENGVR